MADDPWRVRLSQAAERDVATIVGWTADRFGEQQARRYAEIIASAIATLARGPEQRGSRARPDLPVGLRILPIARRAVRVRHVLVYRAREPRVVEIVRILHDAMDFAGHLDQ